MKVFITDNGDPSVGVYPVQYEMTLPDFREWFLPGEEKELENCREWYRDKITGIYAETAEGRLDVQFEDERQAELEAEKNLDEVPTIPFKTFVQGRF